MDMTLPDEDGFDKSILLFVLISVVLAIIKNLDSKRTRIYNILFIDCFFDYVSSRCKGILPLQRIQVGKYWTQF